MNLPILLTSLFTYEIKCLLTSSCYMKVNYVQFVLFKIYIDMRECWHDNDPTMRLLLLILKFMVALLINKVVLR